MRPRPPLDRDPPRDPRLAAWLAELPAPEPDWGALRAAIRRRVHAAADPWGWLARWLRPLLPLAAAAAAGLALWLGVRAGAAPAPRLEEVLRAPLAQETGQALESQPDALLRTALLAP